MRQFRQMGRSQKTCDHNDGIKAVKLFSKSKRNEVRLIIPQRVTTNQFSALPGFMNRGAGYQPHFI